MSSKMDISTRLILEGEREYNASLDRIKREMKTLESQINVVDSSFAGQRNTMAALEAKNKALTDAIAKQTEKLNLEKTSLENAKKLQTDYARQAAEARDALNELNQTTDDAAKETDEYKKAAEKLEKSIISNTVAEENCTQKIESHTVGMNYAQIKLNNLNGELDKNAKYLDEAKSSTDGCAKSIDQFGREVKQTSEEAKKTGEAAAEMGEKGKNGVEALAGALAAAGISATLKEIADALMACVDASIAFESAMAGVAKTTDMTTEELSAMGGAFKEMSMQMPVTASELAQIAEAGGQLGVTKDNLLGFTDVMAKLAVATNMTSDEAAVMLAQFANVTGMSLNDVDRLGSAIVALGNNFATNEKSITEMSQRLASAGTLAGLTEPEILALATAMSSVGIEAEAGGTAMTQTLTAMENAVDEGGDALDTFAATAGVSSEAFAQAWETSPITAIQMFIAGLNRMSQTGQSVNGVLDDLGLQGLRQSNMLRSLSLASDKLNKAVAVSNNAWATNNALNKEAATRFQTTESKIKIYKNSVDALKIAVGDQLTPALGVLADTGTEVNKWAAEFVDENRWLVPAITGTATAMAALAAGVVGVTVVIPALKAAWAALSTTMTTAPIMLVISALAGIAAAVGTAVASSNAEIKELTEAASALPEAFKTAEKDYEQNLTDIDATAAKADALLTRLKELETKASTTELSDKEWLEWNDTLAALVETVPELSEKINLQTGEIEGGTTALEAHTKALDAMAREQARVKALSSVYELVGNAEVALAKAQDKYDQSYKPWHENTQGRIKLLEQIAQKGGIGAGAIEDYAKSYDFLDGRQFNQSLWETIDAYNQLTTDGLALNETTAAYGEAVEENAAALDEAQAKLDGYKDYLLDTGDGANGAAGGIGNLTEAEREQVAQFNDLQKQMDELNAAYEKHYQSALTSISNTVSGFGDVQKAYEEALKSLSGDGKQDPMQALIDITDGQDAYLENYAGNLLKIKEMADQQGIELNDALLKTLTDGSTESAAAAQAIVDDAGENLAAYNDKWKSVEEGKETFATIVAEMQTDFTEKSDAIAAQMKTMTDDLNQSEAAGANVSATVKAANDALSAGYETMKKIVTAWNIALGHLAEPRTFSLPNIPFPSVPPPEGSHAAGLSYVPYDNYVANLHKGERVLTALQARALDAEQSVGAGYPAVEPLQPQAAAASPTVAPIDYERLGQAVAAALDGVGMYMDKVKVADLVTERVSRNIADDVRDGGV